MIPKLYDILLSTKEFWAFQNSFFETYCKGMRENEINRNKKVL